jgi:hypothetical protein
VVAPGAELEKPGRRERWMWRLADPALRTVAEVET